MSSEKILCIEDDTTMQLLIKSSLKNHEVFFATNLTEAKLQITKETFQLILLDINLPDGDGLKFLSTLEIKTPIFVITGQGEIANKITAFSLGADDFLVKPFEPLELRARVDAKIKKINDDSLKVNLKKIGNLEIDQDKHKVYIYNQLQRSSVDLTNIEFHLLCLLTKRLEQVYSRDKILEEIWGETYVSDRTVDSHVAHLRLKIENAELKIETIKGIGYCARI